MKRLTIIVAVLLILSGQLSAQVNGQKKHNNKNMEATTPKKTSDFPVGEENTAYAQYFTGKSWNAPLTSNKDLNVPVNNITFEPGCRNNWHSHTGGQVLIAVGGIGYYQERGKAAVRMKPGDVAEIGQNVEHWHGAAPDSWFSHLAITGNPQTNKNTWLQQVTDREYAEATRK
ncbi:MAG: cupin domain-containing protein [Pedobacter sp.]|nr:MAG: cupin domain-containing protein [Pedobacter sp.]